MDALSSRKSAFRDRVVGRYTNSWLQRRRGSGREMGNRSAASNRSRAGRPKDEGRNRSLAGALRGSEEGLLYS